MNIGEKIKLRRKELRWSQRDLAEKMGYNHSTITRIETGKIDIPQSRILQFADVLRTDIAYLMDWEENENEKPITKDELSDVERLLIDLFRQIPDDQQKVFLEMGRVYANSLKKD